MTSNRKTSAGVACSLALVLSLSPFSGWAQENNEKYAFVNVSQVIAQSEQGVAEAAELEAIGAEKENELNARRQELEQLARQYQETASRGEPDEVLRERIEKQRRELQRDVRQAQSDVDTSRQDRIQLIGKRVVQLIRRFGEENGYTAIFRVDGGQVVYAGAEADITDQIIAAYNEAHPAE